MMCSRQIPSEIRSGIEVVITGLTRNQFVSNHTWVRIPPAAPAQKFPPPLRFRLRRKLRYGGNFFAFGHDSLRWIRGRGETGGTDWGLYLFCQRRTVKRIPTTAPFPASPKTALWWEFLRFRPRFASLDSGPRGDGEVDWELYLFCQESTKRETGIACLSFWCRRLCRWQRQAAAVC